MRNLIERLPYDSALARAHYDEWWLPEVELISMLVEFTYRANTDAKAKPLRLPRPGQPTEQKVGSWADLARAMGGASDA